MGSTGETDFDDFQVVRGTIGSVAIRGEPTFERFFTTAILSETEMVEAADFEGVWFAGDRS